MDEYVLYRLSLLDHLGIIVIDQHRCRAWHPVHLIRSRLRIHTSVQDGDDVIAFNVREVSASSEGSSKAERSNDIDHFIVTI